MAKFSDEFAIEFDRAMEVTKIWIVENGRRTDPPLLIPFSKMKVNGFAGSGDLLGLKIVSRSPAMRELFGLDYDPDKPLKDQI